MSRTVARSLLALSLVLAAGCAPGTLATASPPESGTARMNGSGGGSAAPTLPGLPVDFPVIPSADAVPEADRASSLIGEWTIDEVGAHVYDFYVEALPEAGYPLESEYPGGGGAIIRLRAPGGEIWQLVLTPDESGTETRIALRLDQR